MIEFKEFDKIPRFRREICCTEKIDGTNAAVQIVPVTELTGGPADRHVIDCHNLFDQHHEPIGQHVILAQSRKQFITPSADHYGFGGWVRDNAADLFKLGPGTHYGEWWGAGIQRRYGQTRKRFSLFNVNRWGPGKKELPFCCDVVPLLGYVQHDGIQAILNDLRENGSAAAPGFKPAEGVVLFHSQSRQYYKILLENDEVPKSMQSAA